MLFADAVKMYWADKSRRLRANTLAGYRSALRCHVMPTFAEREIEDITFDEVQRWVDSIPTYGAAEKAYKTFRQVYRWALRRCGIRVWDVTQGVELPARPVVRKRTLTPAEERETLRGIWGQPWEAVVLLQAALGLRRSEACGVDWSDVDWRGGWVHVRRGAHWVSGQGVVEYPTKTRLSDRWVRLPSWALARLRQIRGQRRSGRVIGDLAPHQVAGRFKRFCARRGLPWVPMMDLRHTWATIAIEAGAALEDVAAAMGHTSTSMLKDHYLESMRTVVRRASDSYSAALVGV